PKGRDKVHFLSGQDWQMPDTPQSAKRCGGNESIFVSRQEQKGIQSSPEGHFLNNEANRKVKQAPFDCLNERRNAQSSNTVAHNGAQYHEPTQQNHNPTCRLGSACSVVVMILEGIRRSRRSGDSTHTPYNRYPTSRAILVQEIDWK